MNRLIHRINIRFIYLKLICGCLFVSMFVWGEKYASTGWNGHWTRNKIKLANEQMIKWVMWWLMIMILFGGLIGELIHYLVDERRNISFVRETFCYVSVLSVNHKFIRGFIYNFTENHSNEKSNTENLYKNSQKRIENKRARNLSNERKENYSNNSTSYQKR